MPLERQGPDHWIFEAGDRKVRLSNLGKVYWPGAGYTKGDLIAYYYNVAELILPHLAGRPLTMKRMPDGIEGHEFYEKNAPSHTPDWVPRCLVETSGSRNDFLMTDDVAALLYVANLGCIEFHPLHSQCSRIDLPDYLFFDLDPNPPIEFSDVLAVAHHVTSALDALSLPFYAKTSGRHGMQIYVPILHGPTYEDVRNFVAAIGRAVRDADPDRVTMEHDKSKRTGKVFIDHNMNRFGANIAAVYSLRPRPEATVSTPLRMEEIAGGIVQPEDFTMANVHDRFTRTGDLFEGLKTKPVDLRPAMEALGLPVPDLVTDVKEKLVEYDAKRDFQRTPEPAGGSAPEHGTRFVIQKHAARRLHYDLRLERDGVLCSWAVPRGLPTTPGDRRLAVRTEDHPLEYLDFEAWIPKGEYGGGEMRIFDRGTYEAPEWEPKKITVRLHGERVRGEYHLVKTSQDWLVFLSKRSATEQAALPPPMKPMLAESSHEPFDDDAWTFEPKFDGVRTLAYVATDGTQLASRTGRDQTASYPELANLATYVNAINAVLDGEIVVLDRDGRPSFQLLQQRLNLSSPTEIARARERFAAHMYVFDILWLDGDDLTPLPLTERRERLKEVVTQTGPISVTYSADGQGRAFFEAVKGLGLEGMIAKRLESPYVSGKRTKDWRKIKALRTQDCVVLGWTPGGGSRSDAFGALLVGAFVDGNLSWIGQVGTGFTAKLLRDIQDKLDRIEVPRAPIDDGELAAVRGAHWVRPELVCEVEYLELTAGRRLRAPSFKGFRSDKAPEECILELPPG